VARFRYRALDAAGASVMGEIEAADVPGAVESIRAQGRLPVSVEAAEAGGLWALLNTEITPRAALPEGDRIAFTRALATLAGAGLPIDRALEIVRDLGERRAARAIAGRLLEAVRGGASLAEAMDGEAAAFPRAYRSVVRAGEAGAALGPALARLAEGEEAAAKRRSGVRSALVYPAFLLVSSVGAVAVLLIYVVPTFEPMLAEAGVAPPLSTRIVMAAGRVATGGWPLMLGGVLALALGLRLALLSPGFRLRWSRALLAAPVVGPLRRKLQTARLVRLLGELLASGVALPAALRLAREALSDAAFRDDLARATPEVEAGRGLAGPLSEGGTLSPLALQLIRVGEESGRLAPMLLKAADILDDEAKGALDRLIATLTPTLTLAMGALIALIVSSILFALFSINELAIRRP
jgi:general secretion pathway protein F